jgi:hypothetical protein
VDKTKLAAAFNEWMRRYTENPEQFEREFVMRDALLEREELRRRAKLRRDMRRLPDCAGRRDRKIPG